MTGFSSDARLAAHDTGPDHPERPDRLRAVHRAARAAVLLTSPDPFPDFRFDFGDLPMASTPLLELAPEPTDEATLRLVHTQQMIDRVRTLDQSGGGRLDADTVVGRGSFDLARLAAGGAVAATAAVLEGRVKRAFAAVRPPGHHAEGDRSMGFCLFNNVAIAARVAQRRFGVGRIAVVDFDVHHGNGTQAVFHDDPTVLFVSLHQHPRTSYPGTGFAGDTGRGAGEGFTLNLPLPPGSGDAEYLRVMDEVVVPAVYEFGPELLLLSSGFDAHIDDPLADMRVTAAGFGAITQRLAELADTCCGGRLVSCLEGGYDLRGLGYGVVRHLLALQG